MYRLHHIHQPSLSKIPHQLTEEQQVPSRRQCGALVSNDEIRLSYCCWDAGPVVVVCVLPEEVAAWREESSEVADYAQPFRCFEGVF